MSENSFSNRSLLSLLQWCDSLFPSGAFSHSFGLELAVQSRRVVNGEMLKEWIRTRLIHNLLPLDAVLLCRAYRAAELEDLGAIQQLDAEGVAMRIPREAREGGRMIAARLIRSAAECYPSPWTLACEEALKRGQIKGDPSVAFGLAGRGGGIPLEPTLLGYLYTFIAGQVSAALRLLPLGQREGQQIIHDLLDQVAQNDTEIAAVLTGSPRRPSSFMPALEIAEMQHEILEVRLFQS